MLCNLIITLPYTNMNLEILENFLQLLKPFSAFFGTPWMLGEGGAARRKASTY
jgi:hypothetical protein